jgi:Cysteine-rich CPCC
MSEGFVGYRGGHDLHDAKVVSVEQDSDVARVVIETVDGRRILLEFFEVASLTQSQANGMMLYGLSEFESTAPLRRFVFANWDDDDDARLEVVAAAFERRELVRFPCPCCGYLVFDESVGSYDICPVCGWEDDVSQLRFPHTTGANRVSLIEAQTNFAAEDDGDPGSGVARAAAAGIVRDPGWRRIDEAKDNVEDQVPGVNYGMTYPPDKTRLYYWQPTFWRAHSPDLPTP